VILVIRDWYSARSGRERRLILAMLAIAVPLLAWLLFVVPLSRAYDNALDRHLQAVDRNGRIRALAGADAAPGGGAPKGDLALLLTDHTGRAGLALDSNAPAGPDAVAVTVTQASPIAVSQWLSGIEGQGLRLDDLRMVPAGPGGVSLSVRVSRPGR
jgi:general secretion pathway protein M